MVACYPDKPGLTRSPKTNPTVICRMDHLALRPESALAAAGRPCYTANRLALRRNVLDGVRSLGYREFLVVAHAAAVSRSDQGPRRT